MSAPQPGPPPGEENARASTRILAMLGRPFQTLPGRVVSSVFAATLVTALTVAGISTQSIESFLRGKIDQKFPAILRSATARLDLWYSQRQLDLETLARSETVAENAAFLAARDGARGREARQEMKQYLGYVLDRFPQYATLFLLDSDGQVLLRVGEEIELPPPLVARLTEVSSSRVNDLHIGGSEHLQVVSSPVKNERLAGITLHGLLRLDALAEALDSDDLGTAGLYLVGRSGEVILWSPRAPSRQPYTRALPAEGAPPVSADYTHGAGERVVGSAVRFSRFGWTLVVEEPYDKAFAPLVSLLWKTLGINLAIVVLFSLVAYQVARSIVRPIQALSQGAHRIAAGETDFVIPEPPRRDEIAVLTRTFNEMTTRLRRNRLELEEQRLEIENANHRLIAQNQELQRVNEVFEQLSITDGLTKLHNHRFFQEHLPREMKRSDRTGEPLALILLDIDHFKQLNDRYGHAVGDSVLRRIAEVMNAEIREMDLLARYGGEEFALLAAQTDIDGALALAEKIRLAVGSNRYPVVDEKGPDEVSITVSVGVAAYCGDTKAFFNDADRALYRAKDAGRDCVVVADD